MGFILLSFGILWVALQFVNRTLFAKDFYFIDLELSTVTVGKNAP